MELQSTLEHFALQLKNVPCPLVTVAGVVRKIMKLLYETHFRDAENHRPGRNPDCPDSDLLAIGWLLASTGIRNNSIQRTLANTTSKCGDALRRRSANSQNSSAFLRCVHERIGDFKPA